MGDFLFGGEKSGTPIETRAGSAATGEQFTRFMQGENVFRRMGAQSFANLFGVSPGEAGVPDAIIQMLRDPAHRTSALFEAMEPFERRASAEAATGVRGMFGTMGGRFSRDLPDAEARARGELADRFARTRSEAVLTAEGQRANLLSSLLGIASQNQLGTMGMASQFLAPGAPIYTEGLLPGLLSAGANIFLGSRLGRDEGRIPGTPPSIPPPSNPTGLPPYGLPPGYGQGGWGL